MDNDFDYEVLIDVQNKLLKLFNNMESNHYWIDVENTKLWDVLNTSKHWFAFAIRNMSVKFMNLNNIYTELSYYPNYGSNVLSVLPLDSSPELIDNPIEIRDLNELRCVMISV